MEETRANTENTNASIRNLENQIGQLAKQFAERAPGQGRILIGKETEKEVIIPANVEKTVQKGEEEEPPIVAERKKFELNPEYVRAMAPYPERFKKDAQKQQYARFLDIFKKLHEWQTVTLTEECSAIIQKKFPPKLNDPGSFNIRIAIGNTEVGRALCDLGASINLMPLSVCKSLGITELKPTMVSLQLADRSLRRPSGIIEDVLVKVDKFIFPADFVVLDMEEGTEMPLLLGRPFLVAARAMIDVENGKLELRMNDETITINVFDSIKQSSDKGDCFRLDILEQVVEEEMPSSQQSEEELEMHALVPLKEEKVEVFEVLEKKDSDKEDGAPRVELKELPDTLKYIFLGEDETYPVIINKGLSSEQEIRLIIVLKNHQTAIGWSISDLKGINPSFCTHKILMEEEVRPVRQP
ncbi:uncharacterized protein LOC133316524 [Gastrolobium bilobum]|uniref:uncharacterized protein LOC133316524 n=1 Tax=Gastrolobium bilobum TaxID=150636 RepID=UPI002AB1D3C8|nr:uncharacterized protein LOC133316524 [Gastrolobium bilobum]